MKSNKAIYKDSSLQQECPIQKHQWRTNWLEKNFTEKASGVLVDSNFDINKQCVSVLMKAKYVHQEWCRHHVKGANYSPLFRTKTQLQFIVQSGALKHHINPEKLEQVQHNCQDLLNMTYKNRLRELDLLIFKAAKKVSNCCFQLPKQIWKRHPDSTQRYSEKKKEQRYWI